MEIMQKCQTNQKNCNCLLNIFNILEAVISLQICKKNIHYKIYIYMFFSITLLLLFLAILYLVYSFKLRPQKLKAQYVQQFRQKGYKVYQFPSNFLSYPALKIILRDGAQGDSFKTFKQLYAEHDIVIGNSINSIEITLTEPKLIRQFVKNQQDFVYIKRKIMAQNLERVVGKGLTFSQKDFWKKKRKVLSRVFNFEFISAKHDTIANVCDQTLNHIEQSCGKNDQTYKFDVMKYGGVLASNVILECFLGGKSETVELDGKSLANFLITLINDTNIQSSSPLSMILGVKFLNLGLRAIDRDINRRLKLFTDWGIKYINLRLKEAQERIKQNPYRNPQSVIQALLIQNKKRPEDYQFTPYDILQEFKNFFLAGTDTTSHYIQMIIGYISKNPEIQQKLRKQIQQVIPGQDYSIDNLKKLKCLEAVQKQTTRIYGPVNFNFPRCADKDHYLGGVPVYAGTLVKFNAFGIHYKQQNYKDAYEFNPQRWNEDSGANDPYKLIGFGAGSRSCIGKHLAQVQSKIAIVKLLKRYKNIEVLADKFYYRWKFLYVPDNFEIEVKK